MKIKINTALGEITPGTILNTPDTNGIPLSQYWRRRLEDAKTDNCCEVVKESKTKTPAKAKVEDKPKVTKGED